MNEPLDLATFLSMPRPAKRAWAWEQLTGGDRLLNALCQAVQLGQVAQATAWLDTWQPYVTAAQPASICEQRLVIQAMLACTRLAAGEETLPQAEDTWPPLLGSAWARDMVASLVGRPRPVTQTERVGVLLVSDSDSGLVAHLILERLGDVGMGAFYPDPAAMSFVSRDATFTAGERNALAYLHNRGLWPADSTEDVRWRVVRQDGRPLNYLSGGSAGGAFALALAKLWAGM